MALNPRFVGNLRFLAESLAAGGQFKKAHEVGRAQSPGSRQPSRPPAPEVRMTPGAPGCGLRFATAAKSGGVTPR